MLDADFTGQSQANGGHESVFVDKILPLGENNNNTNINVNANSEMSSFSPIPPSGVVSSEVELRERIFLLERQLQKSEEESLAMKAAFERRSALCRREVNTVVHEYVALGNTSADFSRNMAIQRYVNFINAVTDGATESDMEKRIEETSALFKAYRVGQGSAVVIGERGGSYSSSSSTLIGHDAACSSSQALATTSPRPEATTLHPLSPAPNCSGGIAFALTDPAILGQSLDRIVSLRNERDDLTHRLSTLHIRYKLLLEKLRGQEVAHARITKDLLHKCDTLGRHQIVLNRTITGLEAQLENSRRETEELRQSFEQHRYETSMAKELSLTQVAQLEVQLRAELLRRDPSELVHSIAETLGDSSASLSKSVHARSSIEYACDISLDGVAVRNPSRELLERLVEECGNPYLIECAMKGLTPTGPFAVSTASKALYERIQSMGEDVSFWRIIAITSQVEKNKAEVRVIELNEELARIQECARDRKIDLPFDTEAARGRAAMHSLADERANFKELTRTLRSEMYEATKRVHRIRKDLERLVIPSEVLKEREKSSTSNRRPSRASYTTDHFSQGSGVEYTNLGTLGEETAALETLEATVRQALVDNIVWRKASQRDLAIAHDQLLCERSLWVQQWHTLLDGLPPEVSSAISCDGLSALADDSTVSALIAVMEHSRNIMLSEARAVMLAAEEKIKQSRRMAESAIQTDALEGILMTEAEKAQLIADAMRASATQKPSVSPQQASTRDAMTQTQRRRPVKVDGLGSQRSFVFVDGKRDADDDDSGSAFLTDLSSGMMRRRSSVAGQGGYGDYEVRDASTSPIPVERKVVHAGTQCAPLRSQTMSTNTEVIATRERIVQTDSPPLMVDGSTVVDVIEVGPCVEIQCLLLSDATPAPQMAVSTQTTALSSRTIACGSDLTFDEQENEDAYRRYRARASASPLDSSTVVSGRTDEGTRLLIESRSEVEDHPQTVAVATQTDEKVVPILDAQKEDAQPVAKTKENATMTTSETREDAVQTDEFILNAKKDDIANSMVGDADVELATPTHTACCEGTGIDEGTQTVLLSFDIGSVLDIMPPSRKDSRDDTAELDESSDLSGDDDFESDSEAEKSSTEVQLRKRSLIPPVSRSSISARRVSKGGGGSAVRGGSVSGSSPLMAAAKALESRNRTIRQGGSLMSGEGRSGSVVFGTIVEDSIVPSGSLVDPPATAGYGKRQRRDQRKRGHRRPKDREGHSSTEGRTLASGRRTHDVFMFDTDQGPLNLTRSVEVQVCIRTNHTRDRGQQCGATHAHASTCTDAVKESILGAIPLFEEMKGPTKMQGDGISADVQNAVPSSIHRPRVASANGSHARVAMHRVLVNADERTLGVEEEVDVAGDVLPPKPQKEPIVALPSPPNAPSLPPAVASVVAKQGVVAANLQNATRTTVGAHQQVPLHPQSPTATRDNTNSPMTPRPHDGTHADAAVGPGLFWRTAHKRIGTDLDNRTLRDMNITDVARNMMGIKVQAPSRQEQLSALAESTRPPQLYNSAGHYVGSSSIHPGNRRLPKSGNPDERTGDVSGPQANSVGSVIRVLEPLGVFAGGGAGSSLVSASYQLRRPSASAKGGQRLTQNVAAGPGMGKVLPPLSPEDEAKAQMLARSQSPPLPMFHHSTHARHNASSPLLKGRK